MESRVCFVGGGIGIGNGNEKVRFGRCVVGRRGGVRWMVMGEDVRRILMAGVRELGGLDVDVDVVAAGGGKMIQPLRPPGQQRRAQEPYHTEKQHDGGYREEMDNEGAMTRQFGFWDAVPFVALALAGGFVGWLGVKRFLQRQQELVVQYGEDLTMYGNTMDNMREITRTFKKKLGPGVLRASMFSSYVGELFISGAMSVESIEKVNYVKKLLKISDSKATECFNKLGLTVRNQPSVLGKILFVAERILSPQALEKLEIRKMFKYGNATVTELQKSVLDRVYREVKQKKTETPQKTNNAPLTEVRGSSSSWERKIVLTPVHSRTSVESPALVSSGGGVGRGGVGVFFF